MSGDELSIGPINVDIWRWSLDQRMFDASDAEDLISREEHLRADRFVRQVDRQHYVGGRAAMRFILGAYLKRDPKTLSFTYNQWGKPALALEGATCLHFNLSHSAGIALLAVSAEADIGVDIEEIRPLTEDVAGRFFSATEYHDLSRLPETDRLCGFYRCWTRKEAFVKAHGSGLSLPLDSFDVSLAPDLGDGQSLLRRLDPKIGPCVAYSIFNLDGGGGFCAALAVHSGGRDVSVRYRSRLDLSLNIASMT